jgi:periplasmic divalent cation tolerance protein
MAYSLILSTVSTKDEGQHIARALLERRLVACVNIVGPIESIYRWKGEVENSQEFLMMIKTESEKFEAVKEAIRSLHSYEVPEIVQIPIENGLPSYLTWISEAVGSDA